MDEAAKLTIDVAIVNANHGRESSVVVDMDGAQADRARELIQKVADQTRNAGVTLKTVDVGSDILSQLGGPSHFFDNARNDEGIIIGGNGELGKVSFVFAP